MTMSPERWQRIEALYHDALAQAAEKRAAFLAEACGADTALRQEVEILLDADAQASGFMTTPAWQANAPLLASENTTLQAPTLIGQAFSRYRVLAHLGAGGMGEVYLARDTQLERRVALKLLPLKFTQDAERLQRFIREAKAASALNHPNIITIYEIGMVDSARGPTHFIATEYIEGVTLRAWEPEDDGARLRQTLEHGIQIASALDAAHRAGIVHRDIKPENLMVRPDGLVKVLDFGLAKLTGTQNSGDNQIDTDAQTTPAQMQTLPGMILGTLRYMSPEQARGRALDARTDIFSLGVVLYELLSGKPLFAGETSADVIAAILHNEPPPLHTYLPEAPAELERILHKALAKDSRDRYQTARDLQIDLQALKQESELSARLGRSGAAQAHDSGQPVATPTSNHFPLRRVWWALPLVLLLGGALWWWLIERNRQVSAPPLSALQSAEVFTWQSAIGEVNPFGALQPPKGELVAFTSFKDGVSSIWINLAGGTEQSTKDEFSNRNPVWSPDGKEIAYISLRADQAGIWRKPPLGGTPTLLKSLKTSELGIQLRAWLHDGATLYYEVNKNLYALDVATKAAKQLTSFDVAQITQNTISISPDERFIAYGGKNGQTDFVWTLPVSGGAPKPIATLSAPASKTVWHPDNYRVFFSASVARTSQIFVADRAGHRPVQLTFGEQDVRVLDVSATKVLYRSAREASDVWGVKLPAGEEFPVASDIGFECWPDVAPDGQTIAYQSVRNFNQANNVHQSSILTKPLGLAGKPLPLIKEGVWPRWSPDGKWLAFLRKQGNEDHLWAINVGSGDEKQLVPGDLVGSTNTNLPFNHLEATCFDWSPDGRKLVYSLKENGRINLWMVAVDGTSNTQAANHHEAGLDLMSPLWSSNSKHIAYLSSLPSRGVWVIEVATKISKALLQEDSLFRLLGWLPQDQELVVAKRPPGADSFSPSAIQLFRLAVGSGEQRSLTALSNTYLGNLALSPDKKMIAYVARQDEKDNVWVLPLNGGAPQKLTGNSDPRLYFSSLTWSPDGRALYFGKQTKHNVITLLTNFE